MRPMLQHASRSLLGFTGSLARSTPRIASLVDSASSPASVCLRCQFRVSARQPKSKSQLAIEGPPSLTTRRSLSTSRALLQEPSKPSNLTDNERLPKSESTSSSPRQPQPQPPIPPRNEDTIPRVPDKDLPSHREGQRWSLSKRFSHFMDELLPKLAIVTQKVNNYTGTDYSGIEALRQEIRDQEELVKSRRIVVEEAKQALDAALAQQSSAQKEIVRLLERKNSWLDSELERYMSLIRSEHVNEQAVTVAKDSVLGAELSLEEARSHLEKRERAQYHEEQIWSDTIRRNSTWVTFGLMGVNIFLLLASLIVIDPWRRRRLVREIRRTLDEQKPVAVPVAAPAGFHQVVEDAIDSVVEPVGVTSASRGDADTPVQNTPAAPVIDVITTTTPLDAAVAASDDPASSESPEKPATSVETAAEAPITIPESVTEETLLLTQTPPSTWQQQLNYIFQQYQAYLLDLFSERTVSVRRVDLTSATLEGAAAGALLMSVLLLLARPK